MHGKEQRSMPWTELGHQHPRMQYWFARRRPAHLRSSCPQPVSDGNAARNTKVNQHVYGIFCRRNHEEEDRRV
jgi:hypothetical protein